MRALKNQAGQAELKLSILIVIVDYAILRVIDFFEQLLLIESKTAFTFE
jgi:hypothetical protein